MVGCTDGPTASLSNENDHDVLVGTSSRIVFPSAEEGFAKGAVRYIPDENCGVLDGEGHFVWPIDCRNQISTYSQNGNAHVVVKASGVFNPTGEVVRWDAYNPGPDMLAYYGAPPAPCWLLGPEGEDLFTLNWSAQVTPSGEATFMCHYKKQWEYQFPD